MNFQFYLEKLISSEEYKKFLKENPGAFFCSGFFSIDETGKEKNQQHLDYFVPSINKMFSFKFEDEKIELIPVEDFGKDFVPVLIQDKINFDFDEIKKMIEFKMQEEKIKSKLQKMLFSLQNKDGMNFLIGTIFISGLGLLKIKLDLEKDEIIEFEKKSLFDMMKIVKK